MKLKLSQGQVEVSFFTPGISEEEARSVIEDLRDSMSESNRILPGGYIYLSDLLSTPRILQSVGRIIANAFKGTRLMLL